MIPFDDINLQTWISGFIWPFFRIAAFFMLVPIFGSNLINARIRIMLAILITAAIQPTLPPVPDIELISIESMLITLQQMVIGVSLGLLLQLLFQITIIAGQMIAMQMGLGFAAMVDPNNGVSSTVISQYYLLFSTLLFITFDGHLITLEVFISSFQTMPISNEGLSDSFIQGLFEALSWMFASAMVIALPAICTIFLINISFGIITRAAPQFNVFSIGFPFTMVIGLFTLWVSLAGFVFQFEQLSEIILTSMERLIKGE